MNQASALKISNPNWKSGSFFLFVLGLFLFASCSNTKHLRDGEYLLVKNKVELSEDEYVSSPGDLKEDLKNISIQKPNSKSLGFFRLKLWFYNRAVSKDSAFYAKHVGVPDSLLPKRRFNTWIRDKVGEPPSILDSNTTKKTVTLMENFLVNNGFFYPEVNYRVDTLKKNKVRLVFTVSPGEVYTFDTVTFTPGKNPLVNQIVQNSLHLSKIVQGEDFNVADLKSERERITRDLRDNGYLQFNKDYVSFVLDTNDRSPNSLEVAIKVADPPDSIGHEVFYINRIYVYTDYVLDENSVYNYEFTDTVDQYIFFSIRKRYKSKTLKDAIFLEQGHLYSEADFKLALSRLSDLAVFKFINAQLERSDLADSNMVDVHFYLTPSKKQSVSVDLEVNQNFGNLLGSAVTFTYNNKNLSKTANKLSFNTSGGVEFQFGQDAEGQQLSLINTADVTVEMRYRMNRFLAPTRKDEKLSRSRLELRRSRNAKTNIGTQYKFERRVQFYTLHSASFTFGYDWTQGPNFRHVINPFAVSVSFLRDVTDAFQAQIDSNQSLKNSFEDQTIFGTNYSVFYSNANTTKRKSNIYFRGTIDIAGNFLYGMNKLANLNSGNDGPYQIFGQTISQYFKIDGEIRNNYNFSRHAMVASRFAAGVAVPYGNATVVPYVKQFYVGGPSSIRAYRIRFIGPGSYESTSSSFPDQTGDIKLEASVELRFDIYKWIKGAVFLDAGNIWTLPKTEDARVGGAFKFDTFWKQIFLGTGVGFRADFSYFVMRFDFGVPIFDPRLTTDKWVIKKFNPFKKDYRNDYLQFNLAIGYPF